MGNVRIHQLGEADGKLKFRFTWFIKRKDGKRRQRRKTLSFVSSQCASEWASMKEVELSGKWADATTTPTLIQASFA